MDNELIKTHTKKEYLEMAHRNLAADNPWTGLRRIRVRFKHILNFPVVGERKR